MQFVKRKNKYTENVIFDILKSMVESFNSKIWLHNLKLYYIIQNYTTSLEHFEN